MAKKVKNFIKKNHTELLSGEEGKKWELKWYQEQQRRQSVERELEMMR
jgi:hypothetical protein